MSWNPNTHWHIGHPNARCVKKVRKDGETRSVKCDRPRKDPVHRSYGCLRDTCPDRFFSIEARLRHMEKEHRG